MKQPASGPDPIVNSDRIVGSTSPEIGPESNNVVGRPQAEGMNNAFQKPAQTPDDEAQEFNESTALADGGSFDSVAPLQDVDAG